ncbi:hypothetical protein TKWG_12010 [Advenella kashmirensis WT001]|uniref:Lipoprotein n=1 Tax=Advenella kashmirensis (strain DSM 17095 / LMG 22695 / WT001) TaxID=1036672 RepID=I3UC44_ADVKW|nr:hypothetical protein [Advenella kashmirensis]AFK62582.1 hypothetical protein TKWG_12010 [Advenella kashmirensis WT001]
MFRLTVILSFLVGLSACSDRPDDERLRLALMSDCMVTRASLLLSGKYVDKQAVATIQQECHAAYATLMQNVSAKQLRNQQTEVYDSFQRAYRMKYSLHDVFDSLPPAAKTTYEKLATTLFGLKKRISAYERYP